MNKAAKQRINPTQIKLEYPKLMCLSFLRHQSSAEEESKLHFYMNNLNNYMNKAAKQLANSTQIKLK